MDTNISPAHISEVNLYEEIRKTGKESGIGVYVLELPTEKGSVTLTNILDVSGMRKDEADLYLISEACKRLTSLTDMRVYTDSSYISAAINGKWIEKWALRDWKNAKGEDVSHAEMWQSVMNSSLNSFLSAEYKKPNEYRHWIEGELAKLEK